MVLVLAHHELLYEALTLVRLQSGMKVHLKHPPNKKKWKRDCVFSGGSRNQVQSPSNAFLKPFLVFQSENRHDKINATNGLADASNRAVGESHLVLERLPVT